MFTQYVFVNKEFVIQDMLSHIRSDKFSDLSNTFNSSIVRRVSSLTARKLLHAIWNNFWFSVWFDFPSVRPKLSWSLTWWHCLKVTLCRHVLPAPHQTKSKEGICPDFLATGFKDFASRSSVRTRWNKLRTYWWCSSSEDALLSVWRVWRSGGLNTSLKWPSH